MKVSVIIPCYNIENHIKRCIESVLVQTFEDFELLLLNDGSTDDTFSLLKEYEQNDKRIRIFTHKNHGVSYTRNRGIEEAKGEYLMFIDGDDYVKPDFIEKHIESAEIGIWPISGMISKKKDSVEESTYYNDLLRVFPSLIVSREECLQLLKYYSLSSPCGRMYTNALLQDFSIRFEESISYQEDLLFNLHYLNSIQHIRLLDYFGYFYCKYENSSSSQYHTNFNYTDLLFKELMVFSHTKNDERIIEEFVFNTLIRRIANIYHQNARSTHKERIKEIEQILTSPFFSYAMAYLPHAPINPLLKFTLRTKNKYLLHFLFYLKKRLS